MSLAGSSLWTKTVGIGIFGLACVIGNVSLSAPEPVAPRFASFVPTPPLSQAPDPSVISPLPPMDGAMANDGGQIVPAIYAWDPDVRFVFYRHVSKWM